MGYICYPPTSFRAPQHSCFWVVTNISLNPFRAREQVESDSLDISNLGFRMHATCCSFYGAQHWGPVIVWSRSAGWSGGRLKKEAIPRLFLYFLPSQEKALQTKLSSGSQKRPSLAKANLANFLARVTLQGGRIRDRFQRMTNVTFRRFLLCWSIPSWRDLAHGHPASQYSSGFGPRIVRWLCPCHHTHNIQAW